MIATTGRSVTANMLDLGSSDSGFESRRPDKYKNYWKNPVVFVFVGASFCRVAKAPGIRRPFESKIELAKILAKRCTAPVKRETPGAKKALFRDSNGGAYFFQLKKVRAGDQTKIFDEKFLVEVETPGVKASGIRKTFKTFEKLCFEKV